MLHRHEQTNMKSVQKALFFNKNCFKRGKKTFAKNLNCAVQAFVQDIF